MKAKRSRYKVQISADDYEKLERDIAQRQLRDGMLQGLAIALFALEIHGGWRRKRLTKFIGWVIEVLHMPAFFGHQPTAAGVIDRMRDKYDIDLDKLEVDVDVDFKEDRNGKS